MNRSILAGTVTLLPASSVICLASNGSVVGVGFWAEHASRTKAHRTETAVAIDLKPGCVERVTNKNPADLRFLAGNRLSAGLDNGPGIRAPEHPYARCSKGCKVASAGLLA